ncbi:unnamed protein product [Leuciscus chuanchicus]
MAASYSVTDALEMDRMAGKSGGGTCLKSHHTSLHTAISPSGKLKPHCKPETSIRSGSPFSSNRRLCNGGAVVMATPPLRCPGGWFDELPAVGSQLMAFQLSAISYPHPACSLSTDPGPDCRFQTS